MTSAQVLVAMNECKHSRITAGCCSENKNKMIWKIGWMQVKVHGSLILIVETMHIILRLLLISMPILSSRPHSCQAWSLLTWCSEMHDGGFSFSAVQRLNCIEGYYGCSSRDKDPCLFVFIFGKSRKSRKIITLGNVCGVLQGLFSTGKGISTKHFLIYWWYPLHSTEHHPQYWRYPSQYKTPSAVLHRRSPWRFFVTHNVNACLLSVLNQLF